MEAKESFGIELAHAVSGKKLVTRPLVDKIAGIIDGSPRRAYGNGSHSEYLIDIEQGKILSLVQSNKPDPIAPESYPASITLNAYGVSVSMNEISVIKTTSDQKSVYFVLDTPTHSQVMYVSRTGYCTSDTYIKSPEQI